MPIRKSPASSDGRGQTGNLTSVIAAAVQQKKPAQQKWGGASISSLHEKLRSFVPATIYRYHATHIHKEITVPIRQEFETVCLFVDVSGFTKMSEALARNGPRGPEDLSFYLNRYFERITKLIARSGGDVFKFAGDAMLVLWPPQADQKPAYATKKANKTAASSRFARLQNRLDLAKNNLPGKNPKAGRQQGLKARGAKLSVAKPHKRKEHRILLQRAVQCSMDIQQELHKADLRAGIQLSVKIGIGMGTATVLHVGGVYKRLEYLACGPALIQAFACEEQAQPGDTIVHGEAWQWIQHAFEGEQVKNSGTWRVTAVKERVKNRSVSNHSHKIPDRHAEMMGSRLKKYVPNAIIPHLEIDRKLWSGELRMVTVLFVSIGYDLGSMKRVDRESMATVQELIRGIQLCVYMYQGSLNKFLCDDKGSTLIAAFGLPPLSHSNDATRGILSAVKLQETMSKLNVKCSIGVTSGVVYCGIVGSGSSREYGILGDLVNLSARLMSKAKSVTKSGILCDRSTQSIVPPGNECCVEFKALPSIMVKGKSRPIQIFEPLKRERDKRQLSLANHAPTVGRATVLPILNQDIVRTMDTGNGRVVLLIGEIGSGKSHLMREVCCNTLKYFGDVVMPVWGVGREFDESENSVWEMVLMALLGFEDCKQQGEYEARVRLFFRDRDNNRFYPHLHQFNHVLGTKFKAPGEDCRIKRAAVGEVIAIVQFVLGRVAETKMVLLFLDELQDMNKEGWTVTRAVAQSIKDRTIGGPNKSSTFKGVTMMCASRDLFNPKFMPRFQSKDENYAALRRDIAHEVLNLRILNMKEVANFLKIYFNTEDICPILLEYIMERTGGNPRFCSLMCCALSMQVINVRGLTLLSFTQEFMKNLDVPSFSDVPADISSIIMDGVDRIDTRKLVLLKTGSAILKGHRKFPLVFDQQMLIAVLPIPEYKSQVEQDVDWLVQNNFLVHVNRMDKSDRRNFAIKEHLGLNIEKHVRPGSALLCGILHQAMTDGSPVRPPLDPLSPKKSKPKTNSDHDKKAQRKRKMLKNAWKSFQHNSMSSPNVLQKPDSDSEEDVQSAVVQSERTERKSLSKRRTSLDAATVKKPFRRQTVPAPPKHLPPKTRSPRRPVKIQTDTSDPSDSKIRKPPRHSPQPPSLHPSVRASHAKQRKRKMMSEAMAKRKARLREPQEDIASRGPISEALDGEDGEKKSEDLMGFESGVRRGKSRRGSAISIRIDGPAEDDDNDSDTDGQQDFDRVRGEGSALLDGENEEDDSINVAADMLSQAAAKRRLTGHRTGAKSVLEETDVMSMGAEAMGAASRASMFWANTTNGGSKEELDLKLPEGSDPLFEHATTVVPPDQQPPTPGVCRNLPKRFETQGSLLDGEGNGVRRKRNLSYWEPRVCYVKDEWFWWSTTSLDDEPTGIVNFSDPGTSFRTEFNKPFLYITAGGETMTFKVVATTTEEWALALGRSVEIGMEKRLRNEVEHIAPSFPSLPREFFERSEPNNTYLAFTSGYFRDVVYNLMLFKQREQLHEKCGTYLNKKVSELTALNGLSVMQTGPNTSLKPGTDPSLIESLKKRRDCHRGFVEKIRREANADDDKELALRMAKDNKNSTKIGMMAVRAVGKFKKMKKRGPKKKAKIVLKSVLTELTSMEPRKSHFFQNGLTRPSIRRRLSSLLPHENEEFKRKFEYIKFLRDRRRLPENINPVKIPGKSHSRHDEPALGDLTMSQRVTNATVLRSPIKKKSASMEQTDFAAINAYRKKREQAKRGGDYTSARRASL